MRSALITGATSGIGRELAFRLAKRGFSLILTGRDLSKLDSLGTKLGAETHSIDLAKKEERKTLLKVIEEKTPDLVINNAGFGFYGKVIDLTLEEQCAMCEVNMVAPLEITYMAVKALKNRGKPGVIINVSSIAGDIPTPLMSVYGATKAFLTSLSQGIDQEMRSENIYVLAALPGQVRTEFATRAAKKEMKEKASIAMSVEKAADEILKQIESKKSVHRFDLPNQILSFLCRHFLPNSLIAKSVKMSIEKRL